MRQGKAYWRAQHDACVGIAASLRADLVRAYERISELEGREWHRYQAGDTPAVAMPPPGPDPDDGFEYHYDETGLVRSRDEIPSDE